MFFPIVDSPETTRDMIQEFKGYNHNLRIADGEWYDCCNLSSDKYPVLSVRKGAKLIKELQTARGIICKGGDLYYIDYNGVMYKNNGVFCDFGVGAGGAKKLISFGSYILVFPDGKYYNTVDPTDQGSIKRSWHWDGTDGKHNVFLTDENGKTITMNYRQNTQPENPSDGQTWCDTSGDTYVVKRYYNSSQTWVEIQSTFVKFNVGHSTNLQAGDSIKISGFTGASSQYITAEQLKALDGYHTITAVHNPTDTNTTWITIPGFVNYMSNNWEVTTTAGVTVSVDMPDMDFVCECSNRLWGCKYGTVDGKVVNELYCSALGDFKNWYKYEGLSTDSWAASCGTEGAWTGCVEYQGYPLFFKQDFLHKIYVSSTGAHQVVSTQLNGVAISCGDSLKVVNGILYYVSPIGVMAYNGSTPSKISDDLGEREYAFAHGGSLRGKYYLNTASYKPGTVQYDDIRTFVYDTNNGIWQSEKESHSVTGTYSEIVSKYSEGADILYHQNTDGNIYAIHALSPTEVNIPWYAESCDIGLDSPDNKYVSRFNIRINLDRGSRMRVLIQYDSDGVWHDGGSVMQAGMRSITIPVKQRRCDHARIRLEGKGGCLIYSISKIWEQGSDV